MKRGTLIITLIVIALTCVSCGQTSSTCTDLSNNEVISTIMARRSIRQYKDKPIPRETLDIIAECGINAPSGSNMQPWEIRIVDNKDLINEMSEKMLAGFDSARQVMVKSSENYRNMFRNAAAVVFIACKGTSGRLDCGLLGENMILAAQSMGIGSCCLGGPINFFRTEAGQPYLERLKFSPDYTLLYAIGFGYPDESPDAKPRQKDKIEYIE